MLKDLTASESKIYAYLQGLLSNDSRYVEVNDVAEIANALDLSVSTVYLALKALETKTLIHIFYKSRRSDQQPMKIYMFTQEHDDSFSDLAEHLQEASILIEAIQKADLEQQRRIEALQLEIQSKDAKIAEYERRLDLLQHLDNYIKGKMEMGD